MRITIVIIHLYAICAYLKTHHTHWNDLRFRYRLTFYALHGTLIRKVEAGEGWSMHAGGGPSYPEVI